MDQPIRKKTEEDQEICYTSDPVVTSTLVEDEMKFRAGDRVHLKKLKIEGTVISNDGTLMHPYYVRPDSIAYQEDFYAASDLEASKVVLLTSLSIDAIIYALHQFSSLRQPHIAGLPVFKEEDMDKMRDLVRASVSPVEQGLPERREKLREMSPLDIKIAEDALLFEAKINSKPQRQPCRTLPWGWRYVSEPIQKEFRNYCLLQTPVTA